MRVDGRESLVISFDPNVHTGCREGSNWS